MTTELATGSKQLMMTAVLPFATAEPGPIPCLQVVHSVNNSCMPACTAYSGATHECLTLWQGLFDLASERWTCSFTAPCTKHVAHSLPPVQAATSVQQLHCVSDSILARQVTTKLKSET
jgi:hypothetical protein